MLFESKTRAIAKTISYRLWATVFTTLIAFVFTGNASLAFAIGGTEAVSKLLLYFLHERGWNRVKWGKISRPPFVVWFTGLPSAGKSTLAEKLAADLKEVGYKTEWLDGDTVRSLVPQTGFQKSDRDKHLRQMGVLATLLERNGVIVVASFISPFEETRKFVRSLCQNFIEVYVATPLEDCEKRDIKGLYQKARKGEIPYFTGVSDPYEIPSAPEISLNTAERTVEECINEIKMHLWKRRLLLKSPLNAKPITGKGMEC